MAENAVLDVPPGFAKVSGYIQIGDRMVSITASIGGTREQTYRGPFDARPISNPGKVQTVQHGALTSAEWGGSMGADGWCKATGLLNWNFELVTVNVLWETIDGQVAVHWWLVNAAGQTVWTSGDAAFPLGQAILIVPE